MTAEVMMKEYKNMKKELDKQYELRDRQVEAFVLG